MRPIQFFMLVFVTCHPSLTWAAGNELAQQSAVAGGTACASTARDNDAAAAWYNPAALVDGKGLRTSLALTIGLSQVHSKALDQAPDKPWSAETANEPAPLPSLYASFAMDWWAVGLSVNVPYASSTDWPEDWPHRFDIVSSQNQFLRIAPFFAARLGPLAIAAGPHVDLGSMQISKATHHIESEGFSQLSLEGVGVGAHLAVFARPWPWLAVGLSYKSRTVVPLEGSARFEVPVAFEARFPNQRVNSRWTQPDSLTLGLACDVNRFRLLADLSLTLWSLNDRMTFDFAEEVTEDHIVDNRWQNSLALRLGAEVGLWQILVLRTGFYVDGLGQAAVPAETLSPSSPDSTRLGATVGASVELRRWFALDVFYEHLWLLSRASASLDAPQAQYQGDAHLFGLGLRFHYEIGS